MSSAKVLLPLPFSTTNPFRKCPHPVRVVHNLADGTVAITFGNGDVATAPFTTYETVLICMQSYGDSEFYPWILALLKSSVVDVSDICEVFNGLYAKDQLLQKERLLWKEQLIHESIEAASALFA